MQKHGGIWLALLAAAVLAPVAAMAEGTGDVQINETNFPDEKFRDYVQSELASGRNFLTKDEIASVTTIDVCVQDISDLTGIEHFTALEELDCSYNNLTSLDVSKNTKLTHLRCELNEEMTRLDVSGCAALKELYCFWNPLTTLDVSDCAALETLNCSYNQLTELDVSDCAALERLYCSPPDSAAGSEPQRGRNLVGEPRGAGDRVDRQGRKHYEGPEGGLGRNDRYRRLEQGNGAAHRHL